MSAVLRWKVSNKDYCALMQEAGVDPYDGFWRDCLAVETDLDDFKSAVEALRKAYERREGCVYGPPVYAERKIAGIGLVCYAAIRREGAPR